MPGSRVSRIAGLTIACTLLVPGAALAQTWDWHVSSTGPDGTAVPGTSRVVLSANDVALSYSVRTGDRDVSLTSCRARLGDVSAVRSVDNGNGTYLFVYLKPGREAACSAGNRQIAMVPVAND